jgi:formate dehydrogenase accessory protein FdhD
VLQRVARAGIRAVLSPAAPTSGGLDIAATEGITTIGFARGERFNVYTDPGNLFKII